MTRNPPCAVYSLPTPTMAKLSIFLFLPLLQYALAASRTTPPSGAIVVRAGTTTAGEFSTLSAALASLPNDDSSQSIFIFPGTYTGQNDITREGPLTIYGYTTDTTTYTGNQAILTAGVSAATAGSDDASGTLRIHKNNFKMYNVNVKNTFGPGSQAIAIAQYGSQVGLYACGFFGYQDTLYANEGTQVYLKGYIEGAVDFIFGREGLAYFGGNTIAVSGPGCITASGRTSDDTGSYVFNENTVVLASDAASDTSGNVFLGRPWGDFAKVIFKNTVINAPMNKALWSVWEPTDPNTDDVFFAEFNTTGSGASGAVRPSFATVLDATDAAMYSISSAVGSDFATWVDPAYLV
ncbi:Pectinesterase [Mycena sanguinolenta]|uniref:Pectinesterase n=1 Tax=Mycena sanguinolenta TaxID=230812 RepID=A0A8H6YY49_9AGAR|nr:Pectinesterase [Mycena sanguinolenta]